MYVCLFFLFLLCLFCVLRRRFTHSTPSASFPLSLCSGVDGGDQLFLVDPPIEPIPTTLLLTMSLARFTNVMRAAAAVAPRAAIRPAAHTAAQSAIMYHTKRQKRKRGIRNNHLLRYVSALDVIRPRSPLPVSFSPRCWYSVLSLSVGDEMRSERRIPKPTATRPIDQ